MTITDEVTILLRECEEYFDQRADAEYLPDRPAPIGNEEMSILTNIRAFLDTDRPVVDPLLAAAQELIRRIAFDPIGDAEDSAAVILAQITIEARAFLAKLPERKDHAL